MSVCQLFGGEVYRAWFDTLLPSSSFDASVDRAITDASLRELPQEVQDAIEENLPYYFKLHALRLRFWYRSSSGQWSTSISCSKRTVIKHIIWQCFDVKKHYLYLNVFSLSNVHQCCSYIIFNTPLTSSVLCHNNKCEYSVSITSTISRHGLFRWICWQIYACI